ncbi:hypothetical protein TrCOL_g8565 [Triparma columacea]|uniref:t-SNARE coiled-coil homology domain-containing protein n=1 Tax=Triparma columacea TaxID=722753 RepID=A0A9W7GA71_9STRA|nr:hypothetical protein TrCOL_g8565 [Triparma columacea]
MATRDLTVKFSSLREQTARSVRSPSLDDSNLLNNAQGGWNGGGHDQLPPMWVDLVDQVDDDVRNIKSMMAKLENLHGERVNNIFDKDLKGRDREIEQLTSSITGKFRHAEQLLKRIGRASEPGQTLSPAEVKVRAAIQSSNASKIQQISAAFRKLQQKYLTDVSAQKSGNDSQFGVDLMSGGGGEGGVGFTDQQMAVVDDLEGIVNERDEEIQNIAQSIEELSTIFKELAVLVIDQGTILDRIDFNMEQVVEHTKEGIKQLEKAEQHQKSARPLKCIGCLLVMIAVMLTILILKHR